MKPIYLAGPMSGYPQFNFPAFYDAAADLRERGWNIVSPAELDAEHGIDKQALQSKDGDNTKLTQTWGDLLARDVKLIADGCSGVISLPGWEKSKGARLENFVALQAGYSQFWLYNGRGNPPEQMKRADVLTIIARNT